MFNCLYQLYFILADADEDGNDDDGFFDTEAVEDNGEEEESEKVDKKIEKVLDNAMVESYVYDKKTHLYAKLTFNVSSKKHKQNKTKQLSPLKLVL